MTLSDKKYFTTKNIFKLLFYLTLTFGVTRSETDLVTGPFLVCQSV